MNPKNATNNLAIIGASGTGKTTLAVGLYATSTPEFTVSDNDSKETRKYLEVRKTSIQEGFWPAATNESDYSDLLLSIHAAGKRTNIVFREYMGERMEKDPNYIREVIGKPKSAMILFNPGMPGETVKKAVSFLEEAAQQFDGQSPLENWGGQDEIARWSQKLGIPRFYNSHDTEKRNRLLAELSEVGEIVREFEGAKARDEGLRSRIASKFRAIAGEVGNLHVLGLTEPETRNRMIGNLQRIAQHLKDNGCIAVAFVVTASDRLNSDLKDFRENFESYASEVTNHLTNLRLNWKRFDVTVSGQLDDQNKPQLARGENNTTHEPFLWLLACIKHHEFWQRIKVSATTAAVLLAVAGAAFGGFVWSSRSKLAGAEASLGKCLGALKASYASYDEAAIRTNARFLETNAFERLSAILPSDRVRKDKVVAQAKEQRDLWNVRLLATEFALTSKKLKEKPTDVQLGWFRDFDGKLTASSPSFADAVSERGELADAWEKSRKAMETVCQTAHFRNEVERESKNLPSAKEKSLVEPLKASFVLLMDTGDRYALVTNRSELSAPLLPARTSAIARYVDSETDWEPTDPNPPGDAKDLIRKIRQELKSALSSDEFANLETIVEQRRNEARIAWEKHQFPRRRQAQLDELKGASDSPAISSALKDSLSFLGDLDRLFPSIPEPDRVSARAAITNERALAIGRYIDSKTRWKPEDDDPPGSVQNLHLDARKDLKGALTTHEFDSLESKLTQRRDTARRAWDAHHFAQRASELETALKDAGAKPAKPLTESLAFLGSMTNDYPTISQAEFIRTRASLTQARNIALAAYKQSFVDKWNKDVNGRKPPEFDGRTIRDTILTDAVVTDEEATAFDSDMQKRFQAAKAEWDRKQRSLVDNFAVGGDPETMVSKYGEFCDDWPNNPHLGDLSSKVDRALQAYFRAFIEEYESTFFGGNGKVRVYNDQYPSTRMTKAQQSFNKFVAVCRKLNGRGLEGNRILEEPSGRFANHCNDNGLIGDVNRGIYSMFPLSLRITKIEAKFEVESSSEKYRGLDLGIGFSVVRWDFENNRWNPTFDRIAIPMLGYDASKNGRIPKASSGWLTLPCDPITVDFNPYHIPLIYFKVEDRLAGFTGDVPADDIAPLDFDGNNECKLEYTLDLPHDFHPHTRGKFYLRVTGRRIGADFEDCARKTGIIR